MHYPAWLLLDSRPQPIECVISDMSDTGARLSINTPITLPQRFKLWLDKTGKVDRECEIVWMHGSQVGVHFRDRDAR